MYNSYEGDNMYKDVIVALATPMMESALSIIRVSGENSLDLLREIFSNKGEFPWSKYAYLPACARADRRSTTWSRSP
jgi:tRNA U34 5-carboxymethylaminomethyl modifying GTPase MnmE/TrmE